MDAPRAFSMQLRGVTKSKCNMKSSQVDGELCMRHALGRLMALLTKHVNDLKLTGEPDAVTNILSELQKVVGELKVEWHVFTNCGIRHIQDHVARDVTLDQAQYAVNLRTTAHPQLTGSRPEVDQTFTDIT